MDREGRRITAIAIIAGNRVIGTMFNPTPNWDDLGSNGMNGRGRGIAGIPPQQAKGGLAGDPGELPRSPELSIEKHTGEGYRCHKRITVRRRGRLRSTTQREIPPLAKLRGRDFGKMRE